MPTIDPKTGQISMTMEEFQAMNSGTKTGDSGEKKTLADKWKEMFNPKKPAAGAQDGQQRDNAALNGQQAPAGKPKLTREALMEASKNLQFLQLTPDQQARLDKGDMSAMLEAQNAALQKVFVDAAMASNTLVETSQQGSVQSMEQMIQQQLARHESARTIKEKTSPYLETPGGDVLVSALTRQLSQANPNAAPAEIGDMVSGYLKDFSSNFGNQAPQPTAREAAIQEAQKSATDF